MEIHKTDFDGVYIINNFNSSDDRGLFTKIFNKRFFYENDIEFEIRESYYSISHKNVIRGMHFQLPPHDHEKLVYVSRGEILDVILDLRKQSKTYKKYMSILLSDQNKKSLFIPKGFAHGFKSLEDKTTTIYNVSSEYDKIADRGIKYDSFGFNWEVSNTVISERDNSFDTLNKFNELNPF